MPRSTLLSAGLAGFLIVALAGRAGAQQRITLTDAIKRAQDQSYQAQGAKATYDAARFRDKAFYSRLLPRLSLGGTIPSYNRSIIQVIQPDGSTLFRPQDLTSSSLTATMSQRLPIIGGDFFVSSSLARLSVTGAQSVKTWSSTPVTFGLRQSIFRPNTLEWDKREQPARFEVAERQYREAREDIAFYTANLFFDGYAARVALANAVTNAAVNDTLYTLNKGRFEVGKIGENDLLQSELALLRSRTTLDGAKLEYDRTLAALRLGIELPIGAPIELEVTAVVPTFEADTVRAVAEALRNRSNVTDAALQETQADRRIVEAKLNNGLGATVQASYGFNATAPDASLAYKNLLEARQFALSVDIPLLQWGSRKDAVEAARADRDRALSNTRGVLAQAAQDAHFAALQLSQARRTLALSAKADTVAGKRFEVAYNRYVIGRIAIDNLYVAQSEKDQAVQQFVQSLRGYWQAYFRLRRATMFDFETGTSIQ